MTNDIEIWSPIPEFPYFISSFGQIKNSKNQILKPAVGHSGYLHVTICNHGIRKSFDVHTMVAKCFIGDRSNNMEIDHIDGNRLNNRLDNLRYLSHSENVARSYKNPKGYSLHKPTGKYVAKIRENGKQKYLGYFNTEFEARQAYLSALTRTL